MQCWGSLRENESIAKRTELAHVRNQWIFGRYLEQTWTNWVVNHCLRLRNRVYQQMNWCCWELNWKHCNFEINRHGEEQKGWREIEENWREKLKKKNWVEDF